MFEGIKIYAQNIDLTKRIHLSSGTTNSENSDIESYSTNSYIPKLPWLEPTKKEIEILVTQNEFTEYSEIVSIISFEKNLKNRDLIKIYEDALNDNITHETYKNKALSILESLFHNRQFFNNRETTVAGLAIHRKGLDTVTINKNTGKFVGLHLDSWDKKPINQRHTASNRICINLSKESRYLLFINLPVTTLSTLTDSSNSDIPDIVCNRFMDKFPNYPVVKLEIKPFEAYIAPTENIIHDATTQGMKHDSYSFTYRGFFKIAPPQYGDEK